MREELRTQAKALAIDMDTTYFVVPCDMINSGLLSKIGPDAFTVWCVLKSRANFSTGKSWPGIRELARTCKLSPASVLKAIKMLEEHHLLRVERARRSNNYFPRDCLVLKGKDRKPVSMISIGYTPKTLRDKHQRLKASVQDTSKDPEVWAGVELIPLKVDATRSALDSAELPQSLVVKAQRERLVQLADEIAGRNRG